MKSTRKKLLSVVLSLCITVATAAVIGTLAAEEIHAAVAPCDSNNQNHKSGGWKALTVQMIADAATGSGLAAGNYYLDGNLEAAHCVLISGDVTICLNGKTFTHSDNYAKLKSAFVTGEGDSLTICDCVGTGRIDGSKAGPHSAISVEGKDENSRATVNIYGGTITNFGTASGVSITNGGAVNMGPYGTINMYGGTITGNSASESGGGVYMDGGIFNMYGGNIDNNAADKGGGVYINSGIFNLYNDAVVSDNTSASDGGGFYIGGGSVNMNGGTISGNKAESDNLYFAGGGVYLSGGALNMSGGKITGNTGDAGGGVYIDGGATYLSDSVMRMSGGEISGNIAAKKGSSENELGLGGGIYVARPADTSAGLTVSGTAKVTGNTDADGKASNVYLPEKYTGSATPVIFDIKAENLTSGAKIGITVAEGEGTAFAEGGGAFASYFTDDTGTYTMASNTDGNVTTFNKTDTVTVTFDSNTTATGLISGSMNSVTVPKNSRYYPPVGSNCGFTSGEKNEIVTGWTTTSGGTTGEDYINIGETDTAIYAVWGLETLSGTVTITLTNDVNEDGKLTAGDKVKAEVSGFNVDTSTLKYNWKHANSSSGDSAASAWLSGAEITVPGYSGEYLVCVVTSDRLNGEVIGISTDTIDMVSIANDAVTIMNDSVVYDGKEHVVGVEVNLADNIDYVVRYIKDGEAVTSGTYTAPTYTEAGTYKLDIEISAPNYYSTSFSNVEFTITQKDLTVTAQDQTIQYGDAIDQTKLSYDGFVEGDDQSVLTGTPVITGAKDQTAYDQNSSPDTYTLTPSGYQDTDDDGGTIGNYKIAYAPGTLTVGKRQLTLNWSNTSLTYNGREQMPTATLNGVVNNDAVEVAVTGGGTDAGPYTATATISGQGDNYAAPAELTTQFTIGKARPDIGTVSVSSSNGVIDENTDPAAIILDRSNEAVAGELKLTDTAITADKDTYNWSFTPTGDDAKNYETITGTVQITVATFLLTAEVPSFDSVTAGYAQPEAGAITIRNDGNSKVTISSVALSGDGKDAFVLNRSDGASVAAGITDSTTYTIQPAADLAAGTYRVTVTVTYNNNATATADVTFTVEEPEPVKEDTPAGIIDFLSSGISGLTSGATYRINDVLMTANDSGMIDINEDWFGTTISIVKPGESGVTVDSNPQTISIPVKPEQPEGIVSVEPSAIGVKDGKIVGVAADMEYSCDDGQTWTVCTGDTIADLAAGTYLVRMKATDSAFAGEAVSVVVNESDDKDGDQDSGTEDDKDGDQDSGTEDDKNGSQDSGTEDAEKVDITPLKNGIKTSQTGNKLTIKWSKVTGADGYDVYVQYCTLKMKKKATKVIRNPETTSLSIRMLNGKKLNTKKSVKIIVKAYQMENSEKKILGKTVVGHVAGKNNKIYTSAKKLTLTKNSYTLVQGQTANIKASTVKLNKNKKLFKNKHVKKYRYSSSDKQIATVNKSGRITAKSKGECIIYVYAQNGMAKKVTVMVQ